MIADRERARGRLVERVASLVERLSQGGRDDAARDELLLDVARWQAEHVAPYRRLVRARRIDPASARGPGDMPAVPTDVFRFARVAAHPPEMDVRTFLTSGTTSGARGAHPQRDLALYDRAARAAAARALFPDGARLRLVSLVAAEEEAPQSSLAYMVARFGAWFGAGETVYAWRRDRIDVDRLATALADAQRCGDAVCLVGTSFAFVFAEEALGASRFRLPEGSRVMHTGGFKGRTREIDPTEMRALLSARYGVPDAWIVAEYGMTELSSQMYEGTLADASAGRAVGPRVLRPEPWLRLVVCDPGTLAPLEGDAEGLLRIEDPANVDTAWAIQTSDRVRRAEGGYLLLGRAPGATPRGCSLAVEEALGSGPAA